MPATLTAALEAARARLAEAGIAEAAIDSRLLVEHYSGTTRAHAITAPLHPVEAAAWEAIEAALARRIAGEPVHRIIGRRGFYGLELTLSAETLEPRPDTETVVDLALPLLRAAVARKGACRLVDLGTGTGAIALACLAEVPDATALGVDIDEGALATAWNNAVLNGLADRFQVLQSDWFESIAGRFDAILSNPPYIESGSIGALPREVREFDPRRALDGGADGLEAYRRIAAGAGSRLEPDGCLIVEIGAGQAEAVDRIFAARGFRLAQSRSDLAGVLRALLFSRG